MSKPSFLIAGRAPRAFLVAAFVHAVVLIAVAFVSLRSEPTTALLSPAAGEISVSIELDPASPEAESQAQEPTVMHGTVTKAARVEPTAPPSHDEPAEDSVGRPSSPSSASALAEHPIATGYAPPAIGIVLGAPNAFVSHELPEVPARADAASSPTGAQPHAPGTAEAKQNVEASLRTAAREHDEKLGLGPEGPVLAALEEATFASTAPVEGRATFVAVANAQGMVEQVAVTSCNGSRGSWDSVAVLARNALRGKPLRVAGMSLTSTTTRTTMKIQVVSTLKMPSGHDPGMTQTVLGVPIRKGEGKRPTKVAILDPIPRMETEVVQVLPGVNVRIDVVRWDVFTVKGDPVDIGAKPRRVVHTQLVAVKQS